jgi:DMSO/TMAO reductase YedYZ molybdopterin-dependent catalytic subunit
LKRILQSRKFAIAGLIFGSILIIGACLYYVLGARAENSISWELTLLGKNSEQQMLSYKEIRDLPSQEAYGGFFTTVGVVNGPYKVRGVLLEDLCDFVGGYSSEDVISISAVDGYSMVYDYDQINGEIQTYEPESLHEVPHEELIVLLIYEINGKPLSKTDGKPLRLAVVGDTGLLTEGHNWVKWVDTIEVLRLD